MVCQMGFSLMGKALIDITLRLSLRALTMKQLMSSQVINLHSSLLRNNLLTVLYVHGMVLPVLVIYYLGMFVLQGCELDLVTNS